MTAIFGIFAAFGLIFAAMSFGGSAVVFVNVPAIFIVLLGTLAVTTVSFSYKELSSAPNAIWRMLGSTPNNASQAAYTMIQLAERARKDGILTMERLIPSIRGEPFLEKALILLVDGAKPDEVEQIMQREASAISGRNMRSVDILRRAGEVAPAMGLIGTLIGLVQMLGQLDDPSTIGPAMAVALLTTFYGAILAHMVFIPLAARAERTSSEESILNSIYAMGAISIGKKENPRRLETTVNSILPDMQKVQYFD